MEGLRLNLLHVRHSEEGASEMSRRNRGRRHSAHGNAEEVRAWQRACPRISLARTGVLLSDGAGTSEIKAWRRFGELQSVARKFDRPPGAERGRTLRFDDVVRDENRKKKTSALWQSYLTEEPGEEGSLTRSSSSHSFGDESFVLSREILGVYFNEKRGGVVPSKREDSEHAAIYSLILSAVKSVNGTMHWVPRLVGEIGNPRISAPLAYLDWVLRGFGQIYFCNNTLSGLIILIAISVQSSRVGAHAFFAVATATLFARFIGFEVELVASGLFGYNPGLIGIALASFSSSEKHTGYSLADLLAVVVSSVLSVIVFVAMSKVTLAYETPPMTLPFDCVVSAILLASDNMANLNFTAGNPTADEARDYELDFDTFILMACRGVGQIVFTTDTIPCILILLSLTICSRHIAICAFIGSALGNSLAIIAGIKFEDIVQGYYGYCPALIFMATEMFFVPSIGAHLLAVVGVAGTTILQAALTTQLSAYGIPVNSFPFSFMIISIVLTQGDSPILAVPLESITTPEDHSRRARVLKDGFALFLQAVHRQAEARPSGSNPVSKKSLLDIKFRQGVTNGTLHSKREQRPNVNRRTTLRSTRKSISQRIYSTFDQHEAQADGHNCFDDVFQTIDQSYEGYITTEQFENYLDKIGFSDESGKAVALSAFSLFAIEDNIYRDGWNSFCKCSVELRKVQGALSDFFYFVDAAGDGFIRFGELDRALSCLGQPQLTEEERKIIASISADPNE